MADKPLICPRSDTDGVKVIFKSPVEGEWVIYQGRCGYMWRSTEPDYITDPDKFDPKFKVKLEDMDKFPMMPAIPPLRKS